MPAAKPAPDGATTTRDARRLSTLLEVSQAMSGTLNLKAGMQRVLAILIRHHGVVHGMVTLLREGELQVEAAEGFDDRARAVRYKLGEGITGQVAQSGKPIVVPRISTVVLVCATCATCSYISLVGPLVPMMLEKSYRSRSSCRRCVFSSTRRRRSSSTSRCTFSACAIIELTMPKNFTLLS